MKPLTQFRWDAENSASGPIHGGECEDLDFTLLQWHDKQGVQQHVNEEVDVIMIVFEGNGRLRVDDTDVEVNAGSIVVLPKGASRSIVSTSDNFRYLNIHKRRKRLMPGELPKRKSS